MPNLENLVTAKEIAPLLKRTTRAIQKRASKGEIPCYRIGGIYLFDLNEIKAWLKKHHQSVTEGTHK